MAEVGPQNPAIGYVNFWTGFNGIIRGARYRTTMEILEAENRGIKLAAEPTVAADTPTALATRGAGWLTEPSLTHPFAEHLLRFSGPPGTYVPVPVYQIFLPATGREISAAAPCCATRWCWSARPETGSTTNTRRPSGSCRAPSCTSSR